MIGTDASGLFVGAITLGVIHGIEPGHGWPIAAAYALDRTNKWAYGLAASLLIGIGHLISSIAMVGAFFYATSYFDLTRLNEPLTVLGGVRIGGPVSIVAGVVLIALGIREYRHGHSHAGETDPHADETHPRADEAHSHDDRVHDHDHDHIHNHNHDESRSEGGVLARLSRSLPFVDTDSRSHTHSHSRDDLEAAADRGLLDIAWVAFVLGFAHEEEFEIIALCAGSTHCLELMSAYAITVVLGIVSLTMLLIAGYHHSEERVEKYTPYLPLVSAVVLVGMGGGFVLGVF
ncbi:HoxN/HupN/NixA family nickel/cobalt transporter [Natrinema ejinorense]|uniref:Nickel/cobalt efflux system n=1 Tax=Natrinema ejinorense TaxID=373386 RepID=A0A2A5QV63_9EURY|nr:hypothetical protein [Natrinema ejinorense]PCR90695.1 hypothetical protein CP557_09335 [Natrinema ejinorense]